MISFNIALNEKFEFSRFIEKSKEFVDVFIPNTIDYEYTTNLEKAIYKEKRFNSYNLFIDFFSQNNYRFDSLRLNKNNEVSIYFIKSREELFVYGRVKTKDVIYQILDILNNEIIYAYIHNQLDLTLSKSNKYRSWERKLGHVPSYVKYYENPRFAGGERDKYLIDLESVPTHQHLIKTGDKLWFGACAIMYFSDLYYKYISKEKWKEFTDCEENIVLDNGLRRVILYRDLSDFKNTNNRNKQWAFRNQLGIDQVAHQLIQNIAPSETKFTSKKTEENINVEWSNIKKTLDSLQTASGQTYGKNKLRELTTKLNQEKKLIIEKDGSLLTISSKEELQKLINSYDPNIILSEIV